VRLVEERKVGCAYVAVRRGWKYARLEVDLVWCKFETLGVARDVARLLYDRVISRSEAWARALQKHPIAGTHVIKELLEFVVRGEVAHPDGAKHHGITPYFFESPRVRIIAGRYWVSVVAEKRIVEDAVAEVERLLEERLLKHMPGSLRGGGSGGPGPSQG
jgi:hypothetical protein